MLRDLRAFALMIPFACGTVYGQTNLNQSYLLRQVTTPPGATGISNVVALGADGKLIGNLLQGTQTFPAAWTSSTITPFASPFGNGQPNKITAASPNGSAAGSGTDATGKSVNVYWDSSGAAHVLATGTSPEAAPCCVTAVSDNGVITGSDSRFPSRAVIWTAASANPQLLPVQYKADCSSGDSCASFAFAVSPNGHYAVGSYLENLHFNDTPIVWVDGVQSTGGYGADTEEMGSSVNNSGVIVGNYGHNPQEENQFSPPRAFKDTVQGGLIDLGTLPGATISYAYSVNAGGTVVGKANLPGDLNGENTHAVLWANGSIIDLQTAFATQLPSNVVLNAARYVNNAGQIYLTGENTQSGASIAYVATPLVATRISVSSNINPSYYGQQIHLVATITPDSGPVPLGQVSWYDNGTLLGTAGLTKIGTASWEPSTWAPGVHNVTVRYAGYAPNAGSTSPPFKQTVAATGTRTTLSASANPATHGAPLTLVATVVPNFGTIAGTVTFKSGSTTLGTAAVDGRTKQARLTTTFATSGHFSLTAAYGGSTNFVPTSSPVLSLTVK